jgi:hypothetical protein
LGKKDKNEFQYSDVFLKSRPSINIMPGREENKPVGRTSNIYILCAIPGIAPQDFSSQGFEE